MSKKRTTRMSMRLLNHEQLCEKKRPERTGVATWNLLAFCNEHSKVAVPDRMALLRARLERASSWADVFLLQEVDSDLFPVWVAFFDELGFDGERQDPRRCSNRFLCATFWRRSVFARHSSASGSRTMATLLFPQDASSSRSAVMVGNVHLQAKAGEQNVRAAQVANLLGRMTTLVSKLPATSAGSKQAVACVVGGDFNSNLKEEAAELLFKDGFTHSYDGHDVISYNVGVWEGHIDFLFVEGAMVQALLDPGRSVGPSQENPSDHLMHGILIGL
jgi:endonuclease/exonuclease/phosphatase family metal-dependent hydrolase